MNAAAISLASVLAAMPAARAAEPVTANAQPLQLRPKAGVVQPATVAHHFPPFVEPLADPEHLGLLPPPDPRQAASRSSCAGARSLCYDPATGKIVYKPARAFMPDIPGLTRENISVKRDRIVLRYSFQ
jgi:hypothetical protein